MDTLGAALCVFIAAYVTATTQHTTTRSASRSLEPSELIISFGDCNITPQFTVPPTHMVNIILHILKRHLRLHYFFQTTE